MAKKSILSIIYKIVFEVTMFIMLFSSTAFMFIGFTRQSYSSLSSFLVSQRAVNQLEFTYGEVRTNTLTNYSKFYWYADDVPGSNLKGKMHTCFKAVKSESDDLFTIASTDRSAESNLFLYTTWDFKRFHYSFDVFTNQEVLDIKRGEIYITENLANSLFDPDAESGYSHVLDTTVKCNGHDVIIRGVIKTASLNYFQTVFGTSFILGNYNYLPFQTSKYIYEFMMFGGEIDTSSDVVCIERAVKNLNDTDQHLTSTYYDYDPIHGFHAGYSQEVKENTINNKNKSAWVIAIGVSAFLLCDFIAIFYYISHRRWIVKFRDKKEIEKHSLPILFFESTLSFSLVLLILRIIGTRIIKVAAINFFDYNVVSALFLFWVIITIVLMLLQNIFQKEGRNHRSLSQGKIEGEELEI